MSSLKTSSCDFSGFCHDGRGGEIVKMGYLRKLKTMKKRFFILRRESSEASARLEYYEDEKKWKKNHAPRRTISLKTCFNINRRQDTKHKHVIALYTKDDCFGLVLDSEEELEDWLKALLSLQYGEDIVDGEEPKPTFEHVWQVTVLKKGLGNSRNILGRYLLCLTDKSLSLVKMTQEEKAETYEFSLVSIRRCGHSDCFFYMEVGRSSCTGEGELWMQTEDTNIADNMHAAILHAMTNNSSREEQMTRPRSSSTNEVSKPINVIARRQTHVGGSTKEAAPPPTGNTRTITSTEQDPQGAPTQVLSAASLPVGSSCHHHPHHRTTAPPPAVRPSQRRHSVSAMSSAGSANVGNHQRTYSFPLSELGPHTPWDSRRGSTGRMGKRTSSNVRSSGRERSDSVPSRPRTVSDGGPHPPHPHTLSRSHIPNRPHSVCISGSPISPASEACTTDSPGSSLSIDEVEAEGWAYGHSLTPDEPVILEENSDDWPATPLLLTVSKTSPSQVPMAGIFKSGSPNQDAYSPYGSSPLDPVNSYMTMSPGTAVPETTITNRQRATSSSNHSRASSIAEETPNGYVPMAPVDDGYVDMDPVEMSPSSSCSITSGTPSTDMRFSEYPLEKVSSYFTPSEEDETSSLDRPTRAYSVGSRPETMRRNNRLEILNQADASRVRAFSVGSRTNKLSARALASDNYARQHTTLTPPHHQLTPTQTSGGKKSLSAPLLCNSWSGGGSLRHHLHGGSSHSSMEPMDDLMEMDFTRNSKGRSKSSRSKLEDKHTPTPRTPATESYVDMNSRHPVDTRSMSYVEMNPRQPVDTRSLSYVEMNLRQPDTRTLVAAYPQGPTISPRTSTDYHAQSHPIPTPSNMSVSPRSIHTTAGPYMEMRPGSSPPTRIVAQRKISTVNPPSPEVKILNNQPAPATETLNNNFPRTSTSSENSNFTTVTGQPYGEVRNDTYHHGGFQVPSSRKPTSPIQEEYMDMSRPLDEGYGSISSSARTAPVDTPQPRSAEGYVEMEWTGGSRPSQRGDDYMNMAFEGRGSRSGSGSGSGKRKEKRKGRYSSQPIVIQGRENDSNRQQSSSTSPVFSLSNLIGRKHSTGTPPKMPPPAFLPLSHAPNNSPGSSPSSSLRRNKSRKTSRRDSAESAGFTTPTGSNAAIFPFSLNSPGSPMKPFPGQQQQQQNQQQHQQSDVNYDTARKCPVDATSGTVRLSYPFSPESNPATPDSSSSSSEQPTPVNAESLNDLNKVASPRNHDYVNYSPFHQNESLNQHPGYGDYAVMKPVPVTLTRKISAPARVTTLLSDLTLSSSARTTAPKLVTSSSAAINREAVQFGQPSVMTTSSVATNKNAEQPGRQNTTTVSSSAVPSRGSGQFDRQNSTGNVSSGVNAENMQQFRPAVTLVNSSATPNRSSGQFSRQNSTGSSSSGLNTEILQQSRPTVTIANSASNRETFLFGRQNSTTSTSPAVLTSQFGRQNSLTGSIKGAANSVPSSKISSTGKVARQLSDGKAQENASTKSEGAICRQLSSSSVGSIEGAVGGATASASPASSRPPSVSSERELHYASLDLAPSGSEGEEGSRSPRSIKTQGSQTESSTSSPSPNPVAGESTFTYAEIDFAKSEGLRSLNRKH